MVNIHDLIIVYLFLNFCHTYIEWGNIHVFETSKLCRHIKIEGVEMVWMCNRRLLCVNMCMFFYFMYTCILLWILTYLPYHIASSSCVTLFCLPLNPVFWSVRSVDCVSYDVTVFLWAAVVICFPQKVETRSAFLVLKYSQTSLLKTKARHIKESLWATQVIY